MPSITADTQLLLALWKQGAGDVPMPTWPGILDSALYHLSGVLNRHLSTDLTFHDTMYGIKWDALQLFKRTAFESGLVKVGGDALTLHYTINLDQHETEIILRRHNISPTLGREIGRALAKAVTEMTKLEA